MYTSHSIRFASFRRTGFGGGVLRSGLACFVLVMLAWCGPGSTVTGQESNGRDANPARINVKPKVAEGIGVDSKTGQSVPMDLTFRDSEQRLVELGTYFDGTRPVMLSFNYSDCPKLCSVQLENMTLALREVAKRFKAEQDFQVVSVSMDPNEQWTRAKQAKEKYVGYYNQPGTEAGWHFLTGEESQIQELADACGFRYKYVPSQKLFSHPPVFILLSPDGKIVRYIHGLDYEPETIEQALIESAQGKIGSPINLLSYGLGCFVFDEATGKYTFQAMAIMRIGAILTVGVLLFTLVPYWFFRRGVSDTASAKTGLPAELAS